METAVIVLNVILAIILVILVLLQRSEGGALGLGLSQDNFASTRTFGNFLTKSTAIIAALFIIIFPGQGAPGGLTITVGKQEIW